MSAISLTKIYNFLIAKWGRETAENVTNFIDQKFEKEMENKSQTLATKDDIRRLEVKVSDSRFVILTWVIILWAAQTLTVIGLFLSK